MESTDYFGLSDPIKTLEAPEGFADVDQAGYSWAVEGQYYQTTTKVGALDWNRLIAQFRGLFTIDDVDLSDLDANSPFVLREALTRSIAATIGAPGFSNVVGTSGTVMTIGTGTRLFDILEAVRGWGVGARLRVASRADPSNFMEGVVADYSGDMLELNVGLVGGSGTFADWTVSVAGEPGTIELEAGVLPVVFQSIDQAQVSAISDTKKTLRTNFYGPSTVVGKAEYRLVSSEPSHNLKIQSGNGKWFEIYENVPNETQAGAIPDDDGVTGSDNSLSIQNLINWAMIDPHRRMIQLTGRNYCASDLTNVHDVQWSGPGSLRIGTGPEFFVAPNKLNRGFSGLGKNTLYVSDETGTATASGLAPEFAVTPARAERILGLFQRLLGLWELEFSGVVTTPIVLWESESTAASLYFRGEEVDAVWDNTNPPPEPMSIASISAANPPVVGVTGHGRSNGEKVFIGLATKSGGMHEADGNIYTVANVTTDTFELSGVDGSAWSAYTGGGKMYALVGARPKTVFYGSGEGSGSAFRPQGNDVMEIHDMMFINWGTKATSGEDGGIIATANSNVRAYNVHAFDNTRGIECRDQSIGIWQSGEASDNRVACKAIDARVTFGKANVASPQTDTLLLQRNFWACDVWEMASGHFDGNRLVDNSTDLHVRKNSHMVALQNHITNTGAAKFGFLVEHGGYLAGLESDNTWVGAFRPHIQRRGNASIDRLITVMDWVTVYSSQIAAIAPSAGEVTIASVSVPLGGASYIGQGFRVELWTPLRAMAGTLKLRFKKGSTTIYERTIPLSGTLRDLTAKYQIIANNFDVVRGKYEEITYDGTNGYPFCKAVAGGAWNTLSAGDTFSVTAEFSNAADQLDAFGFITIDTKGF